MDSSLNFSFCAARWICSKFLTLPLPDVSLTPSPVDISMESPSSLYCINRCNNNLLCRQSKNAKLSIEDEDAVNKANILNNLKRPGQAVQIIMKSSGEHEIIQMKEENVDNLEVGVCDNEVKGLKGSRSCTNFEKLEAKWTLQGSKSSENIKGYQSCDENLIKFIFTKHGIQIISDIETIV